MMNGSTESRGRHAPQPATAIASHRVRPDKVAEYVEAQTAITDAARRFVGFVGTEVLGPVAGLQEEWVAIFRLESNQAMKRWLASPERLQLAARIENFLTEPSRLLVLASDDSSEPPVAMVFAHRVATEKVADYLAWRRRAIAAQAHHPGYIATEFFEPHGKLQDEWVDIVRYDSVANLTNWMESKERQDLLKELESIVESMHAHRLTGLEGWFGVNRGPVAAGSGPPPWKQALAVLFALYPTVMVLAYLNPLMSNLSLPVQMLISNLLSVALLTWLVMPGVTQVLGFWLAAAAGDWKREALGLGTVAFGLGLFVGIFRMF
jgi:antibiotic biosynthesis monooxygenase (ABM) superfamily enzyme